MALNPFEQALVDEGIAGTPLEPLARSIYRQESSSGRNTQTSNAGAVGGMQILPGTFNEVMPGGNINDPYQNSVAGLRYIKKMNALAGGDPSLTAAGYYGGPGGLEKAKQGIAVSDPRNPNAPTTLQYAQQVTGKVSRETLKPEDVIQDAGRGYQAAYALMSLDDEDEAKYKERQEQEASDKEDAERFNTAKQMLANVKVKSALQPVERAQGSPEEGEVAQNNQSSGGYERWLAEKIGVDQAWDKAMKAPSTMGYSGDSGTAGDAVRHMTLMREIGKKYGETPARMIGWAHEYIGGPMQYFSSGEPQSSRDREMDIHNNALGLELSRKARDDAHFNELVREALKNRQADYYREEYNDRTMPISGGSTGFTGETRKMLKAMPKPGVRKRAGGSPEEGEVAAEPSLKETAATMWASLKNPEHWKELGAGAKRAAVATPGVVESVGRGAIATVPGTVGDVESLGRMLLGNKDKTFAPTTRDILNATDKYRMFSKPEGSEDLEEVGGWISPAGAPASAMLVKGASKALKPSTAKSMLQDVPAPRAEVPAPRVEPTPARVEPAVTPAAPVAAPVEKAVQPVVQISPDKPFVGGVEQFIADKLGDTGKGTVGQIRGMIAKSGREHDIARLDQALAGMSPTDKITAKDLLERLKETSPKNYRLEIIEPSTDATSSLFYHSMENPRPSTNKFGVVNLLKEVKPEQLKIHDVFDPVAADLYHLKSRSGKNLDDTIARIETFFNSPEANNPAAGKAFSVFKDDIKKLAKEYQELDIDLNAHHYPTLYAERTGYDYTRRYIDNVAPPKVLEKEAMDSAINRLISRYGEPVQTLINSREFKAMDKDAQGKELSALVKNLQGTKPDDVRNSLDNFLRPYADIVETEVKTKGTYSGQHSSVTGQKNNPIGFSRFIDVSLPNKKDVMVFSELQSDMLDDLRKLGPRGGSVEKDIAERAALKDQIEQVKTKFQEAQYVADTSKDAAEVAKANNQLNALHIDKLKLEKRMKTLQYRKGEYSMEEAFPGMEKSQAAVQQLLIKNGVVAGVQRGKNGVLLPGSDSKQAQLYENIGNQVKAVLKDLGPGFEMKIVPFETEGAGTVDRVGIFWNEKAAERLQRQGVRFAKGGLVEKNY